MPAYIYTCPTCDAQRWDMRTVAERHDGPTCDRCREPMKLLIGPTPGVVRDPAVPRKQK